MSKFLLFVCLSVISSFPVISQLDSFLKKNEIGNLLVNYSNSAILSQLIQKGQLSHDLTSTERQSLCFVSDIKSIVSRPVISKVDSSTYETLTQFSTTYIVYDELMKRIAKERVVIINEAHDRIKPRLFIYELLPLLKEAGFTHLAMETVSEGQQNSLTCRTGVYTCEPMMGLIYRRAQDLGFSIFGYDSGSETRDSMQAVNLYKRIVDSSIVHKTFVIAGYGHLEEWFSGVGTKPMGVFFKQISGIDPFTIDQIQISEGSRTSFNNTLYHYFSDSITTYIDGSEFIIPPLCDVYVCHPRSKFKNDRSEDVLLGGERVLVPVKVKNKHAILFQLYFAEEVKNIHDIDCLIPADQTTYVDFDRKAYLAFSPNVKYFIVMRNRNNEIVSFQRKLVKKK